MARAGSFDELLTVEENLGTQDPNTGETVASWQQVAAIAPFAAARRDLKGDELFRAQQIQGEISIEWTAYWRKDLKVAYRIVDQDGTAYDIKHVGRGRQRGDTIMILTSAPVE